jgi:hypothetical protein
MTSAPSDTESACHFSFPLLLGTDMSASVRQDDIDSNSTSLDPGVNLSPDHQLSLTPSNGSMSHTGSLGPHLQNSGQVLQGLAQILRPPESTERFQNTLPLHSYGDVLASQPSSQVIPYSTQKTSSWMSDPRQDNHGSRSPTSFPDIWTQDSVPLFSDNDDCLQSIGAYAGDIEDNIHALERDVEVAIANLGSQSGVNEISSDMYETQSSAGHDTRFPSPSGQIWGEQSDQSELEYNFDALMKDFTNVNDSHLEVNHVESPTSTSPAPNMNMNVDSSTSWPSTTPYHNPDSQPVTNLKRTSDVANLEDLERRQCDQSGATSMKFTCPSHLRGAWWG